MNQEAVIGLRRNWHDRAELQSVAARSRLAQMVLRAEQRPEMRHHQPDAHRKRRRHYLRITAPSPLWAWLTRPMSSIHCRDGAEGTGEEAQLARHTTSGRANWRMPDIADAPEKQKVRSGRRHRGGNFFFSSHRFYGGKEVLSRVGHHAVSRSTTTVVYSDPVGKSGISHNKCHRYMISYASRSSCLPPRSLGVARTSG